MRLKTLLELVDTKNSTRYENTYCEIEDCIETLDKILIISYQGLIIYRVKLCEEHSDIVYKHRKLLMRKHNNETI